MGDNFDLRGLVIAVVFLVLGAYLLIHGLQVSSGRVLLAGVAVGGAGIALATDVLKP